MAFTKIAAAGIGSTGTVTFENFNVSAGTTSAPSISPSGDSNTGVFFPAADTISASTGGTSRLRISSAGEVTTTNENINLIKISRGAGEIASNTAVGTSALSANTTGSNNTANGVNALLSNTIGVNNTANGVGALRTNTTGNSNTANGYEALYSNITGNNNTANGFYALRTNTTGGDNTATGYAALSSNTIGSNNTANGLNALNSNTTGNNNTATGCAALRTNTTGSYNTANGVYALYYNTTGTNNTANGVNALYSNETGSNNTAIGFQAGYGTGTNSNTTGANNTFIGNESVGASGTASNVITLGNGSIATLRCQVTTITSLSDARDKTNITNLPAGLDFINALRPVSFDWNTRDGKKVGIPEFGFIAQELQEAQVATGITVPNLVSTENPDKLEASAGTLLPVLVNAVQELTAMVKDLQAEIEVLKSS